MIDFDGSNGPNFLLAKVSAMINAERRFVEDTFESIELLADIGSSSPNGSQLTERQTDGPRRPMILAQA